MLGRRTLLAAFIFMLSRTAIAITIGATDTFTGSLDNWQKGQVNAAYLSVAAGGGPGGAGDSYMQSVADGGGSFGRLTVFNGSQWNSNYVADGITAIRLDLLNSGTVPLQIRLGLRNSGGVGYISSTAYTLGVGGGWQTADLSLSEAALTAVGTPGDYTTFLAGGFALRLLHATSTSNLNGDVVSSTLGVDNVTAVPEPAAGALACLGGLVVVAARWRRVRSHRSCRR